MNNKGSLHIDVKSLSHTNLVKIIEELKYSDYQELLDKARYELIERLKRKGFDNRKIATILVANVYGRRKKRLIAQDWADALELTVEEFLNFIGMR